MKKFLYIFIFLVSVSLSQKAFANCEIKATPIKGTDDINIAVSGCPTIDTKKEPKAVYRVVFGAEPVAKFIVNDNRYPARYQFSKPTIDTNFNTVLKLNINARYSVSYKYLSVYKFTDPKTTNIKKGTPFSQEILYTPPVTFKPFKVSEKDANGNVTISGGIDSTDAAEFYIRVSPTADFAKYGQHTVPAASVQPDGTFSITDAYTKFFPSASPDGATFYITQAVSIKKGKLIEDTAAITSTNSTYGNSLTAAITSTNSTYGNSLTAQTQDKENHSYSLLSDPTGKTTIWDFSSRKCVEYNAWYDTLTDKEKKNLPEDRRLNCNISDLLNTVIRIAIGLAIVALVIRIMYEGFIYMTTDIPGVKLSAKGSIVDMAVGILIALGSWVILNTINPTLVNNTITIKPVYIERVDVYSEDYARETSKVPKYDKECGVGLNGTRTKPQPIPAKFFTWNAVALKAVQDSGLSSLKPKDMSKWFSTTNPTPQDWVNLLSGMICAESHYNPNETYQEDHKLLKNNSGGVVVSTGLLQISKDSLAGYKFNEFKNPTTQQLKNPEYNIRAGAYILSALIKQDNYISSKTCNSSKCWKGGARYWSVLRY